MSTIELTSSITLQDIKLSLAEAGKGESILCLPGNPGNKSTFSNLMTKLSGTNIKLLALDRPGHNSTDELHFEKGDLWYDTSIYASLIDAKLHKKTWILGHGYGCLTAIKIAIKNPEKVKGLLLVNPSIIPDNSRERVSIIPNFAKGALIGSILGIFLPSDYDDYFRKLIQNVFLPEIPTDDYMEVCLERFERYENIISYIIDKNVRIQIQKELKENLSRISCPVSALIGNKDGLSDLKGQKEILSSIPNIKIEELENMGHYIPYLNPDECLSFIKKAIAV